MRKTRPTRDALHIEIAGLISLRGTCGRLQVGAVITKDSRIISSGYNGPLPHDYHCSEKLCDLTSTCVRAIHAEANAILYASQQGISCKGATLYTTHQPCLKCAELIILAGITEVVYKEPYRINDGKELLERHGIKIERLFP